MPVIDEFMVRLGASVDASGMNRFYQALREASSVSEASASAISSAFLKTQVEIVGGFVAIGTAVLGMVDKVAMADQQYRLFAMHMFISKDAARSLKIGMDALGASMGEIRWDPTGELQGRMRQLQADQLAMAPGGDFDEQMRKIRDVRFEFTRMEVEMQYMGMNVVQTFMKSLGMGPDTLLEKLQTFNKYIIDHMPAIADKIVALFGPVWQDMKDVFSATAEAVKATGVAFTDLIGLFTGDHSIEGTTFNLEKFAGAIVHIVHGFAVFAEAIANVEELLAHLISALVHLATGDFSGAASELGAAFHSATAKAVGGVIGGVGGGIAGGAAAGALAGTVFGPVGTVIGGTLGAAGGALGGFGLGANIGNEFSGGGGSTSSAGSSPAALAAQAADLAQSVSKATGIRADLLWAQWAHETGGFTHLGQLNNLAGIRLPGTKLYQPFGSLADFGKRYAEVIGNTARYAGIAGAQNTDEFAGILKRGGYYEDSQQNYAAGLSHYDSIYRGVTGGGSGSVSVGNIIVNISKPHPSNDEVAGVVARRIQDMQGKAVQRNVSQQQDLAYSY